MVSFTFATLVLLAGPPRFLGPPEKKPAEGEPAPLAPGDPAPPLAGRVANAEAAGMRRFDLAALVGPQVAAPERPKAVLISFFSRDTAACFDELPVLEALYTQYRNAGLRVVSLAASARSLLARRQVTFPVVADQERSAARRYLGRELRYPSFALIGSDGKAITVKKGYRDDPSLLLRSEVEAALR